MGAWHGPLVSSSGFCVGFAHGRSVSQDVRSLKWTNKHRILPSVSHPSSRFGSCSCLLFALLAACGSNGASSGSSAGAGGTANGGAGPGGGASGASSAGVSGTSPSAGTGNAGASGSTGNAGAAGSAGTGGGAPAPQTVSSWLGTNVSADLPRVDIAYQLNPFDTPAAQKDENGYPVAGASGTSSTDLGFVLTSGTYKLSYKGTGKLSVSGIAAFVGAFQAVGDEQRAELKITGSPGNFGQFLTLKVENAAGQSVTDIHIRYPGFDYESPDTFLPEFLRLLKPFRALRFMDWEATNNNPLVSWAERPAAAHFGQSGMGQPYEHIVALVNQTGKDAWITIPEHANDDYVTQLAKFLAQGLDFTKIQAARDAAGLSAPFQLILESSNETWNGGFSAYKTFLAAAKMDAARYPGTYAGTYGPDWMSGNADLMRVAEYEADRLAKHAAIFRGQLGAHAGSLAPVLSGWALGAVYSDAGLRFIADKYGDPKTVLKYVAMAPYFGADDAQSGSLSALFTGMAADIASKDATYADFAKLVGEYGLSMAAYEGGQGLTGAMNQPLKHLAQHDQRMYDTYLSYFALWKKHFGEATFMHFSLAGDPGLPEPIYQYGYWGSISGALEDPAKCGPDLPLLTGSEMIASVVQHCPKYRALAEQVP